MVKRPVNSQAFLFERLKKGPAHWCWCFMNVTSKEMEVDIADNVPCSSIAVDSVIRMGTAGLIWGSCSGPYDANKLGMFAAIFSSTRCGLQRYRRRNDWVNVLTAGVVAGAAFGAGTRNWKQVAGATGLVCLLCHVAEDSR
ncbi:outer envelope pore protein 16-4, chloroplastic isoform X2 [Solanum dulcamara]|uniref:outer envelope pore protein 16-4, chloroplastic isoform X2 n=1 Tax=Solanum dulcamara TaxID=45834 RepID=UPI002486231E|nr:outer envelope pore protein 16-4, chloroplastic isoform X2 [Solanum dulcamara]